MFRVVLNLCLAFYVLPIFALPEDFVYLHDVAPSIIQDLRYAGEHNFVGRKIKGYEASRCILTRETAEALAQVKNQLQKKSLSLKVYDCYRPRMAVADFMAWSREPQDNKMKAEFYPRVDKKDVFKLGYVAWYSGHSRGSTVDLSIVSLKHSNTQFKTLDCAASYAKRYHDNSLDMGTEFDCFDPKAHVFTPLASKLATNNRMMFRKLMLSNGFLPYEEEWWHFTLKNERFPDQYFEFKVE